MASKQETGKTAASDTPLNAFSQLQKAGMGNMLGASAAWVEALGDMGAEFASFLAERIKEDVQTQHEMMHCKNVTEFQHIQAQFVQKAMDQYQAETGKLVEMGTKAFQKAAEDKQT
ncbi:phasin family protein [Roseobacter sp. YSTF-M11]|uniref:Phasin family protein n=1 Tax=Roseobacter insulae TaxID=2859783 RepID=A0A9X1FRK6_9RHOB|nr:phasin family protein [Roseobacter insulae]MBW4706286.1 phasin family protein [Roseobacter insulae]